MRLAKTIIVPILLIIIFVQTGFMIVPQDNNLLFPDCENNRFEPAEAIWSDNFNDGNYDGWTVTRGALDASDGVLRGATATWNWIYRDCISNNGTWSFDVYYAGVAGFNVWFLCNYLELGNYYRPWDGYFIHISEYTSGTIQLRRDWDGGQVVLDSYDPPGSLNGWWNIEVDRTTEGWITVRVNGTEQMEVYDDKWNESLYFFFESYNIQAIDNILVDDEIMDTTTTVTTTTTSTSTTAATTGNIISPSAMTLIYAGVGIALVLVFSVAAVSLSKRKHHRPQTDAQGFPREPASRLPPTATTPSDSQSLVLGALKSYPRVSMRELSKLLSLPEDEVRRLTLKLIAAGAVTGAFDRSMDEFVSVSGTKVVRDLESDSSKTHAFPSCPFCGASLNRPLGAGESMKCENCGKMMKG